MRTPLTIAIFIAIVVVLRASSDAFSGFDDAIALGSRAIGIEQAISSSEPANALIVLAPVSFRATPVIPGAKRSALAVETFLRRAAGFEIRPVPTVLVAILRLRVGDAPKTEKAARAFRRILHQDAFAADAFLSGR